MCGRFTQRLAWSELVRLYRITEAEPAPNALARYNVAPTQPVAVVRRTDDGGRVLSTMRWGLVPAWARDAAIGAKLINARAETVLTRPAFRRAMRRRRCLIPADGFYEWQPRPGRAKQPYLVTRADGRPFAFAGLWERWDKSPDRQPLLSCTILTTDANALLAPIHDRMPVIVGDDDHERWLDGAGCPAEAALGLLRPCPLDALVARPVGTRVNRVANDDAGCVEPLPA
jgi:putative SOS response-associated peptidase YedK